MAVLASPPSRLPLARVLPVAGHHPAAPRGPAGGWHPCCALRALGWVVPVASGVLRRSWRPRALRHTPRKALAEAREVHGKGLGMLATAPLAKGQLVLEEAPALTFPWVQDFEDFWHSGGDVPSVLEAQLREWVEGLSEDAQREFWSLHDHYASASACGVALTNALPVGEDSEGAALCLAASRFNHSCVPNVNHTWHEDRGVYTFRAMRDIEAGEELTICYATDILYGTAEERRDETKERFLFRCKCTACSQGPGRREASDRRRSEMRRLDDVVKKVLDAHGQPQEAARGSRGGDARLVAAQEAVEALVTLLDEELEGNPWLKSLAYQDGSEVAYVAQDEERVERLLEDAYEQSLLAEGEGGAMGQGILEAIQRFADMRQ